MPSKHFGRYQHCHEKEFHKITVKWKKRAKYNFHLRALTLKCTKRQRADKWVDGEVGTFGGRKCYLQSHLVPVVFPGEECRGERIWREGQVPTSNLNTSPHFPKLLLTPSCFFSHSCFPLPLSSSFHLLTPISQLFASLPLPHPSHFLSPIFESWHPSHCVGSGLIGHGTDLQRKKGRLTITANVFRMLTRCQAASAIISFKFQNRSVRPIHISFPTYLRGSWGTERLRNLPKVTQLISDVKSLPRGCTASQAQGTLGFEFRAPDSQVRILSITPQRLFPPASILSAKS